MTHHENITLSIGGMTCGSCVRHVREALEALEGVRHVEVDLQTSRAVVSRDPAVATLDKLVEAVNGAGYEAAQA